MVSEKAIIEKIGLQKSNYTSPESAQDQANSLESLSIDIYTDNSRFIYELLQNADDASYGSGKLDMFLTIVGKYLIVAHQGEAFSEVDIESICSVGDGNKKGDENKTGFKGIGFKSVFSLSNLVIINSGNYCFRFDKDHWSNYWNKNWGNESDWKATRKDKSKEEEVKMPWQIIPIWTNLESSFSFLHQYNVSTIICFEDESKLENELFELFSNPQILLFLRSQEVKISIQGPKNLALEKIKLDNTIRLKKNGEDISTWLLKSFVLPIDSDTMNSIKNDVRIPKKLRQATKTEISFAIQLEDKKIKIADKKNRLVYSYLPTSVNYDFPFLVNGSFITDAGRQHLHEDFPWNIWLFQQIPYKLFEWLSELAKTPHRSEILRLVPNKLSNSEAIAQAFNKGFDQAISTIAFIPNIHGALLKVSEAILDRTYISNFINKQLIINYLNLKKSQNFSISSFILHLEPTNALSRLGVKTFEIDDLEDFFLSNAFKENHNIEGNYNLIKFLHEISERVQDSELWNHKLKNIPFIFNQESELGKPVNLLFSKHANVANSEIVHSDVCLQIKAEAKIYNWLLSLGLQEPSDIAFINLIINQPDHFVNHSNCIEVIRFIFRSYLRNEISDEQFTELRKVKLLTKGGSLLSCEKCYLSDFFTPIFRLEKNYQQEDIFVSEQYFEGKDDINIWKAFFIKMKVKQNIDKYELSNTSIGSLSASFGEEYFDIDSGELSKAFTKSGYGYGSHNVLTFVRSLSFLENTANNYPFAKLFWSHVIGSNEVDLNFLTKNPTLWYGIGNGYNGIGAFLRNNYFEWFIKNKECIPTTSLKCCKPNEVYLNSLEILAIAGKYLPVFDCEEPISYELKQFFGFISELRIEDYLNILSGVSQDVDLDKNGQIENQKRIGLIYEKLAALGLHHSEKHKIQEWGKMNKLLARDGIKFFAPNELTVVTKEGEGFKASNLAFIQRQTPEIIELFRLFGVAIVDKVNPSISNSKIEIKGLKSKLILITPLVALVAVEKSKNPKEWKTEFERIEHKLSKIRFYETSEIYLSYGNEEDKQKRSSWAEGDNFYYVGDWFSPRILDGLVEPLGKFLNIHYAQRILTVLLLESFVDGIEYLIEKGFDLSLIPEDLLNPKEPQVTGINQSNRIYNQSDEDLGNKGEKFVFEELKRIYTSKYKQSAVETSTGFKIPGSVEVFWRNIASNTTENHDFKIVELGKDIYIDSKATPYSKNVEKVALYISGNELSLMETAEKYLIARVFNVTTKPEMELIKLEVTELARQKPMYNIIV